MNRASDLPLELDRDGSAYRIAAAKERSERLCGACSLAGGCLPGSLPPRDFQAVEQLARRKRRLAEGAMLCRAGESFRNLFVVRSGALKSVRAAGGTQRIMAFHLPGDMVGLDAISTGQHGEDVIAMEDSEVCLVAFAELQRLQEDSPGLQRRLLRILSAHLIGAQALTLLLGGMSAEQRIAAFLLMLSKRHEDLGYAPNRFVLRMRQIEIGSYLGLTYETVSRAFAQLKRQGLISVERHHWKYREIELRDHCALREMVGFDEAPARRRS